MFNTAERGGLGGLEPQWNSITFKNSKHQKIPPKDQHETPLKLDAL